VGQAIRRLPETPALRATGARPEPLGSWLARERRLRGLTLDELAAATRIPRRSLERLEAGAFDAQPDGFTRGFVRTVADAIGLDPFEASARLLGEAAPPRRGHAARARVVALALALLVAAALLAAAVPAWWRSVSGARRAAAPAAPQLTRRDFVRELARERAPAPPRP
jgi:cytoskeletal protein RodZ